MFSEKQIAEIKEIAKMPGDKQIEALKEFSKQLTPEQIEYLKGKQECLFCGIANKKINSMIVYEDEDNMAVMDINPASLGHLIVMPKKHQEYFWQTNDNFSRTIRMMSDVLIRAGNFPGLNMVSSNGIAAGQQIGHAAVHLIPRNKDDGINIRWDPRNISKEQIAEIASKIIQNLPRQVDKEEKISFSNFSLEELAIEERIP